MVPTSISHRDWTILFGVALVLGALLAGLATGGIYFNFRTWKRSENRFAYWSVVALYSAVLTVCIYVLLSDRYHRLTGM